MALLMCNSDKGTGLSNVIASADASNHAIPTANELTWAFTKLVSANVVEVENGNYKIVDQYLDDLTIAYNQPGGLFETGRKGEEWLNESGLDVSDETVIEISKLDVSNAYNDYVSKTR